VAGIGFDSIRRSWLAYDPLRSNGKTYARGVSDTTKMSGSTAASQQIASKLAPTPSAEAGLWRRLVLIRSVGVGLPTICRKATANPDTLGSVRHTACKGFAAGARQIAGKPAPTASGQNQKKSCVNTDALLPEGRRSWLAYDLLRSDSKS
jgi:hypothetical protein